MDPPPCPWSGHRAAAATTDRPLQLLRSLGRAGSGDQLDIVHVGLVDLGEIATSVCAAMKTLAAARHAAIVGLAVPH